MKVCVFKVSVVSIFIAFCGFILSPMGFGIVQAQSNLNIEQLEAKVNGNQITFIWRTTAPARGRVDFGLTSAYDRFRDNGTQLRTDHEIFVSNLDPEKTYHYRITAFDAAGNAVHTFDQTVKTGKEIRTDFESPEIGNIDLLYYSDREAYIAFTTNEDAQGWITYGVAPALNKKSGTTKRARTHEVKISGLSAGTLYRYVIHAKDKYGNASESAVMEIRTLLTAGSRNDALEIQNLRPMTTNDQGLDATSVVISYRTNRPTTATLEWGTSTKYGKKLIQSEKSYEHRFVIDGLSPRTLYHFRVSGKDVYSKSVTSGDRTFETRAEDAVGGPVPDDAGYPRTPVTALYRDISNGRVYAVLNGQKRALANPAVLASYRLAALPIQDASPVFLRQFPDVRLVRAEGTQPVYYLYLNMGKRKLLKNAQVFESYAGNRWNNIVTIPREDFAQYADLALVRTATAPAVYLITADGTMRRPIVSASAFERNGYRWDDVGIVNEYDLASYTLGDTIR